MRYIVLYEPTDGLRRLAHDARRTPKRDRPAEEHSALVKVDCWDELQRLDKQFLEMHEGRHP